MNYGRATGQQIVGRGGANVGRHDVGWGPVILGRAGLAGMPWGGLPWSWRGGAWPWGGPGGLGGYPYWGWGGGYGYPYYWGGLGGWPNWGGYGPFGYLSPYGIAVAGDRPPAYTTGWAPPAWALPALGGAVFGAVVQNAMHRRN